MNESKEKIKYVFSGHESFYCKPSRRAGFPTPALYYYKDFFAMQSDKVDNLLWQAVNR